MPVGEELGGKAGLRLTRLKEKLDASPPGQRSICPRVGRRSPEPELLLDLGGQTCIIPRYSLFIPFLADQALFQLDDPPLDMLILSSSRDGPVLGADLCVDWGVSFFPSLGRGGVGDLTVPTSSDPSPVLLIPGLRG